MGALSRALVSPFIAPLRFLGALPDHEKPLRIEAAGKCDLL